MATGTTNRVECTGIRGYTVLCKSTASGVCDTAYSGEFLNRIQKYDTVNKAFLERFKNFALEYWSLSTLFRLWHKNQS